MRGTLPRDGIRKTECVHSRHKFNRSPDDYLRNEQNHQTGKVHVGNHEARYEPRFGERLYREYRGTLPHCKIYEPIEGIEYSTEYRAAVGSLQPQNYRHGNSKLEQRKVCYTSYWSEQQLDQKHLGSSSEHRKAAGSVRNAAGGE
jgi:hypothetical protein